MPIRAAVITISDRAFNDVYEDRSGPVARDALAAAGFDCADIVIVPDDAQRIFAAIHHAIHDGARLVLTTGGTGVSPRDVTPEATAQLGGQELPGIAEAIRRKGLENTPFAIASRGISVVVRDGDRSALVVNAPGSRGGARDATAVVIPVVEHILGQLDGLSH